jgi:hypothetical protein
MVSRAHASAFGTLCAGALIALACSEGDTNYIIFPSGGAAGASGGSAGAPYGGAGGGMSGSNGTGGGGQSGSGSSSGGNGGSGGNAGGSVGGAPTGGASGTGGAVYGGSAGVSNGGSAGAAAGSGGQLGGSGGKGGSGGTSGSGGTGGSSGTGGTFGGECAGEPTWAAWSQMGGGMTGDRVVFQCTVVQAGCAGLQVGVDYLFECNQSHVPNCMMQTPETGYSWTLVGDCDPA